VPTPFATANDGCSGQTLGLADTCTVDVSFSPAFVGAFDDSLDLPSNDADEPSVRVAVSGSGVATPVPNIHVADSAPPNEDGLVPFGTVTQGGQADQTVTVTNNGTAALLIGQIAMDDALLPPFSVQADTCSNQTLASSEPCTFGVRFEPTATGPFDDTFDIPSNDADTPTVVTVTGTGAATAVPDIRITDPTAPDDDRQLSFDDVRKSGSFERVITVLNVGAADLVIGVIGTPTPLSAPFSVVAGEDDCSGETIIPTGSCTVWLRFEPTAIDSFDDTFSVPSNDPDEPTVTVSVAGNGVESPPAASISPEGADSGFMALDPVILLLLGAGGACECRRRRRRAPAL
jgi:hypothetical protein